MHLRGESTGANLLADIWKLQKEMLENQKLRSESETCPECEGSNLNEDHTVCWDCMASDYAESVQ